MSFIFLTFLGDVMFLLRSIGGNTALHALTIFLVAQGLLDACIPVGRANNALSDPFPNRVRSILKLGLIKLPDHELGWTARIFRRFKVMKQGVP